MLLPIIILIILRIWYFLLNFPKLEQQPVEDIVKKCKTGDIILFHAYDNINPFFISSFWGHIGIVYRDAQYNPMLFEAVFIKNSNSSGIVTTDLKTRLEKYLGFVAYKPLNSPLDPGVIEGFNTLIEYAKQNMYYNNKVFRNSVKKSMGEPINCSINCGELVFISLIKLGLIPETEFKKRIYHHLLYTAHIEKLQNNKYNKPIEVIINRF